MNGTNLCVDPELVLSIWILLPNIAGTSISYPKYGVHTGAAITNDVTKSKIVGWGYKGIQVKECRDLPTMVIYIIKCSRKKNIYKFLSVFVFSRIDFQNSRTQCQIQVPFWVFFKETLNLRTFQGKNQIQGLSRICTNPVPYIQFNCLNDTKLPSLLTYLGLKSRFLSRTRPSSRAYSSPYQTNSSVPEKQWITFDCLFDLTTF